MAAPPIVQANKLTLLGLVQQSCQELGIRSPTQIFGATDNSTIQLLALSQREGKEFYNYEQRKGGWQELRQQDIINLNGVTGLTGNTTLGSKVVTGISSTASLVVGWALMTTSVPNDTHIVSIDSGTQVTLDTASTITAVGASITAGQDRYPLPVDYDSYITTTSWDRSFRWQLLGPLDAQEWQVLKSGISPTGPRSRFRIMGGYWNIDPPPTSPRVVVFEYYSNSWCQSVATIAQNKWTADTDYYTLDDDCFIMGLKWRYKAAKGLDYTQEKHDYDMLVQRKQARNGANRDLPINAQSTGINILNSANVPDTGFGS
jgi:hypothetical protein